MKRLSYIEDVRCLKFNGLNNIPFSQLVQFYSNVLARKTADCTERSFTFLPRELYTPKLNIMRPVIHGGTVLCSQKVTVDWRLL